MHCTKNEVSSVNVTRSAETADLVTFTEGILNGKLHFLCSDADIDITKLRVQIFFKSLITGISENKDFLVLYHTDHNSRPLHFKSDEK